MNPNLPQNKVLAFHLKYGFPRNMLHNVKDPAAWLDVGLQRQRLIAEEHLELTTAWHKRDIVGLADGLGDLLYVTYGTAVAAGIDLDPIFNEIHRSNMTKDVGEFKPVKGKDFKPPAVRELLLAQGFDIRDL